MSNRRKVSETRHRPAHNGRRWIDKFGKVEEDEIMMVYFNKSTVDQINFDNFLTENIYDIADVDGMHPDFRPDP